MKWLLVLTAIALVLVMTMHSQPDYGRFRLGESQIVPEDDSPLRALLYRKPVLLTFDDGPENTQIDQRILAILRKHHAHAIWFLNCRNFDPALNEHAADNRRAIGWITADGHLLGNHTYTHPSLLKLDPAKLPHEIGGCSTAIAKASGVTPVYFRPPFGVSTPEADAAIRAAGMRTVLWADNSYDSFRASFKTDPQSYLALIKKNEAFNAGETAEAGDVILLHDYPNTALALDGILTRLEARGFQFVTP